MKAPTVDESYFIVMMTLKLDRIPCRKGKCQEVSVCLVVYARGFSKAAWKRLPTVEKFAILKEKE